MTVATGYIYIDGGTHRRRGKLSRRTQITRTDRQHTFLQVESDRTGLSMAELVRRALDGTYRPHLRPKVGGVELSLGLWARPDAAVVGRRQLRGRLLRDE